MADAVDELPPPCHSRSGQTSHGMVVAMWSFLETVLVPRVGNRAQPILSLLARLSSLKYLTLTLSPGDQIPGSFLFSGRTKGPSTWDPGSQWTPDPAGKKAV